MKIESNIQKLTSSHVRLNKYMYAWLCLLWLTNLLIGNYFPWILLWLHCSHENVTLYKIGLSSELKRMVVMHANETIVLIFASLGHILRLNASGCDCIELSSLGKSWQESKNVRRLWLFYHPRPKYIGPAFVIYISINIQNEIRWIKIFKNSI